MTVGALTGSATRKEVPEGEVGELFALTPTAFDGYWKRPEESAAAFRDGYCTAGDMARRDADSVTAVLSVALRPLAMTLPETGPLLVDRGSVAPSGKLMLRPDERVRVALRAPANATVVLRTAAGELLPLRHTTGVSWSTEVAAHDLAQPGTLVVTRGTEKVNVATAAVQLLDQAQPRLVELDRKSVV